MARIRPFRAYRYNEEKIRDVYLKFSPLFDVVSQEQLASLYEIPNNSIHLSVPRSHEEALGKLQEWKSRGIIRQDPAPGIYVYYQYFRLYGDPNEYVRKGFITMVGLTDSQPGRIGDVILHEDTIRASVKERRVLLEKLMFNIAPTHGLYEDPDFSLEALMDGYMQTPQYEYIDYQGVINKLAIVNNQEDIRQFMTVLEKKKIYLADGHHRLASSYALKQKQENEDLPPDSMTGYHLMYLTNLRADDLRIHPIHRLVRLTEDLDDEGLEELLERIRFIFQVEEITHRRAPIYQVMRGLKRSVGMVAGRRQFLIKLWPDFDPLRDIPLDLPDSVKKLAYTQLHYFMFERILGIAYRDQPGSDRITYLKDYATAVRTASLRKDSLAFITSGLSMDDMMAVCETGALMPQKSTYFYPKVVCGMVFASIDDNENNSPLDTSFRLPEKTATPSGDGL